MPETDDEIESRIEAEEAKIDAMSYSELRQYHETATENNRKNDKYCWKHICRFFIDLDTANESMIVTERRSKLARLLTIEEWREMGEDVSLWDNLNDVKLSNCGLTDEKLEALFGGLDTNDENITYECPIEDLDLSNNSFGAAGIEAILPFLKGLPNPCIHLNSTNLGSEGLRLLSQVRINELNLSNSQIGRHVGLGHLLSSNNSAALTRLDITRVLLGRTEFEIISSFLERDDISLRVFGALCNVGEHAKMIVNALTSNKTSKLEFISLQSNSEANDPLLTVHEQLRKLFMDTTTFETLCQSNHHLEWYNPRSMSILWKPGVHENTSMALCLNERKRRNGATPNQILRSKIRMYYFTENGQFDVEPFYGIDVNLMPHLLQLVTRKEENTEINHGKSEYSRYRDLCHGDLGCIFRILRNVNVPDTFEQPKLIEMKKAEVDMLKANNTSLKADTATLKAENASLQTENESMKDMLEKLTKEIEELRCCKKHSKRVKTK